MNRHQLNSINMRRNVRMHSLFLMNISKRRNRSRYQKIEQCAYTLFLVHLPYSINTEIIIHVFYHPWHQHCIIWVMNMRHNISSRVSKSIFWRFRIKFKFISAVIFLWDITNTQLSYFKMAYIHAIWYISESVYLSNCVFFTRQVAPDWSLYYSLR